MAWRGCVSYVRERIYKQVDNVSVLYRFTVRPMIARVEREEKEQQQRQGERHKFSQIMISKEGLRESEEKTQFSRRAFAVVIAVIDSCARVLLEILS
jgi:hypothetical protein